MERYQVKTQTLDTVIRLPILCRHGPLSGQMSTKTQHYSRNNDVKIYIYILIGDVKINEWSYDNE